MDCVIRSPMKGRSLEKVQAFLREQGLGWDEHIQTTVALVEEVSGEIFATGSRHDNVLKCIAVSKDREGEGLTATVVTELVKDALAGGHSHLFLFTKPDAVEVFGALGFHLVSQTGQAALLENRKNGIAKFVAGLERPPSAGVVGGIVANCNPFTNGHRYLVERAAAECGLVHLFILSEDRSAFPADVRLELARRGTEDLEGVVVHPTSDYLISSATFPDYFIKEKAQAKEINCELDLTVFGEHFAGPLGIGRRYVGTEPHDPVTASYNRQMRLVLPRFGVEVAEVPRRELDGAAVSASTVRRLLAKGDLEGVRQLVPPSTFAYLAGRG